MTSSLITWKIYTSVFVTSAGMSIIASSIIVIMVGQSTFRAAQQEEQETLSVPSSEELATLPSSSMKHSPFHRIIFAMSIADIFQSIGVLVGPFSVPSDVPQGIWAIGNVTSCRVDAFIYSLGILGAPMYILLLCYYCRCQVIGREFAQKTEWKIQIIIIAVSGTICISGLITDSFHSAVSGSFCTFAAFPASCRLKPDLFGECDEASADNAKIYNFVLIFGVYCFCFTGVVICMFQIWWNVFVTRRRLTQRRIVVGFGRGIKNDMGVVVQENSSIFAQADDEQPQAEIERQERLHRREFIVQAWLYVSVYLLTYGFMMLSKIIVLVENEMPPMWVSIVNCLFPLGGVLNILVYTRPKVLSFRRKEPDCSWIRAFMLVVRAGVLVPKRLSNHCSIDDNNNELELVLSNGEVSFPSSRSSKVESSASFNVSSAGIVNSDHRVEIGAGEATNRVYYTFPINAPQEHLRISSENKSCTAKEETRLPIQQMGINSSLVTIEEIENEGAAEDEGGGHEP